MPVESGSYIWTPEYVEYFDNNTNSYKTVDLGNYRWTPNFVRYFDKNTDRYEGTVVGNTPLELQIEMVRNAGKEAITSIRSTGDVMKAEVKTWSDKYAALNELIKTVTSELVNEFGGGFVLGTSELDMAALY